MGGVLAFQIRLFPSLIVHLLFVTLHLTLSMLPSLPLLHSHLLQVGIASYVPAFPLDTAAFVSRFTVLWLIISTQETT